MLDNTHYRDKKLLEELLNSNWGTLSMYNSCCYRERAVIIQSPSLDVLMVKVKLKKMEIRANVADIYGETKKL